MFYYSLRISKNNIFFILRLKVVWYSTLLCKRCSYSNETRNYGTTREEIQKQREKKIQKQQDKKVRSKQRETPKDNGDRNWKSWWKVNSENSIETAEEQRDRIESRLDEVVDKKNECTWKLEALNTDLQHSTIANQRKTQGLFWTSSF